MSYTIAFAGKGGTGKTTLAALLVRILVEKKAGSILAIDADPNSNLGEALGVKAGRTIGSIIDDIAAHPEKIPAGISKDRFTEYEVQTAIDEEEGFDILSMGKPEGPGCYCYINNVLRALMGKLIDDYDYIIMDNEAGLEHFSRRTTRSADCLVVVSDATVVGLRAAQRITELVDALQLKIKKRVLIVNSFDGGKKNPSAQDMKIELLGTIPVDNQLLETSARGGSLMALDESSVGLAALRGMAEEIIGAGAIKDKNYPAERDPAEQKLGGKR